MKEKIDALIKSFSKDEYLLNPFATSLKMVLASTLFSGGLQTALDELSVYLCCYDIQLFSEDFKCLASIREPNVTFSELIRMYAKPYEVVNTTQVVDESKPRKLTIFSIDTQRNLYYMVFVDNDLLSEKDTEEIILITQASMYCVLINYERLLTLNSIATCDSLTGVYNRLAYQNTMSQIKDQRITYILADLFRLKKINDQYGHFAGDKYIMNAARILSSFFPNETYRIGGDEFAIVCTDPTVDVDSIMNSANEELQKSMTAELGDIDIFHLNYGFVTGFEMDSDQVADTFYRQADQHLSKDKSNFYKKLNIDRRA